MSKNDFLKKVLEKSEKNMCCDDNGHKIITKCSKNAQKYL
jgi:hypothetical protein